MSEPTPAASIRLTDQQTVHDTMLMAQQHIPLCATGYRCQTADVWRIVLAAAARHTTIEAVCADLERTPDANTVRGYLSAQLVLAEIPCLERHWNELFRTLLPVWLPARPQEIAVDFHDEPYYGQADPDDPNTWVCRGEARAGTTRFYRCATAYIMQRDVRLTVAVVFVKPTMEKVTVLKRLLRAVQAAGVPIKCLYADKGFCSIPVLRYLSYLPVPAIIAMPIRGKQAGTRALCQGRTSYRTSYTLQSTENGSIRVPVAVVRTMQRRRSGQRQVRWLVYVCLRVRAPARQIRPRSRRRSVDGAGAGTHHVAQSGAALPADGRRALDCQHVDSAALAVSRRPRSRATPRGARVLSSGTDDALLNACHRAHLWCCFCGRSAAET